MFVMSSYIITDVFPIRHCVNKHLSAPELQTDFFSPKEHTLTWSVIQLLAVTVCILTEALKISSFGK